MSRSTCRSPAGGCTLTVEEWQEVRVRMLERVSVFSPRSLPISGALRRRRSTPWLVEANDRAINLGAINALLSPNEQDSDLPRKEVIQPHLPVRLPCYDFVPITNPTFDGCLLAVGPPASGVIGFHDVTGGVYKAREHIHRSVLTCGY